jgi:hypothetical protein
MLVRMEILDNCMISGDFYPPNFFGLYGRIVCIKTNENRRNNLIIMDLNVKVDLRARRAQRKKREE